MEGARRLSRRRYNYTPRRSSVPARRAGGASTFPVIGGVVAVVVVIAIAFVMMRGGGAEECSGAACEDTLALNNAPTAGVHPTARPTLSSSPEPAPEITGAAATVIEAPCGETLYALNEHQQLPPASLTKMMTALVAVEHGDLEEQIASPIDGVQLSQATDATVMGLEIGQKLTLHDLLYGLLMRSANDAALTIAQSIGGSQAAFMQMMNDKATDLGLDDTHFANPHGLDDPANYSSAHDLALLGQAVLGQPALAQIVKTTEYTPDWDGGPLENINLLLNNVQGAIGVKTGYTDVAGQTIVGAASREGRTLIVSVLHSGDVYVDAGSLLEWAFANTEPACGGGQAVAAR